MLHQAVQKGKKIGHDSLIEEKARLLIDKYNVDVIVLAQLSIARAKNNLEPLLAKAPSYPFKTTFYFLRKSLRYFLTESTLCKTSSSLI